jgi:hypothetical protein
VEPTTYRIGVRERLTDQLGSAFVAKGMTVRPETIETALTGLMRNQSQLDGLLDRVRDLGPEPVGVQSQPRD